VEVSETAVEAEDEAESVEVASNEPESNEREAESLEVASNEPESSAREAESVEPQTAAMEAEPAQPETLDTRALPTRVPGMSGAIAPEATDDQGPRPRRRPLATSFFGARKAVEVEPDHQAPDGQVPADDQAQVAQADVAEAPTMDEARAEAPTIGEEPAEAATIDEPVHEPVVAQAAPEVVQPLPPAPAPAPSDINDTPIFRAMMSNWLTDDTSATSGSWSTNEADAAWSAAARIEAQEPTEESSAGLPKRRPGSYLVPGAMDTPGAAPAAATTGSRRDPETIRRNLNRHHQGVSSARTEAQDGTQREEADVHH
jgi:hypothetical protein